MRVCCVHYSVSRQSRSGPFLFYGSRSNRARALITQNIPCRRSPARSCDEELRPMSRINQGNVLVLSPPIGHVSLFFPSVCVFSSLWRSTLHSPSHPRAPSPAPRLHLTLFSRSKILQKSATFFALKRERIIKSGESSGSSPQRAVYLLSGRRLRCGFNALA